MKKKLIIALISVLTLIIIISVIALTGDDTANHLLYEIKKEEVIITGTDGTLSGKVTIPDTIEGYPVTAIAENAFENCTEIKKLIISDNVKSVGEKAFAGCENLASVSFGSGVTSIGEHAFYETGIESVVIPDNVEIIMRAAFHSCDNLTEIVLPDKVMSVGLLAFGYNAYYYNEDNWENGVMYIGKHLVTAKEDIVNCEIKEGTLTVADGTFKYCHELESVTIPDSVVRIGTEAFFDCTNLGSITIPSSVTEIGDDSFVGCNGLETITVAPDNEFYCNDEYGVLFNKDKTELIKYPSSSSTTEYVILDSVQTVDYYAFANSNNIKSVTVPDGITIVGLRRSGLGYGFNDGGQNDWWNDLTVYGKTDSDAQLYAQEKELTFVSID